MFDDGMCPHFGAAFCLLYGATFQVLFNLSLAHFKKRRTLLTSSCSLQEEEELY